MEIGIYSWISKSKQEIGGFQEDRFISLILFMVGKWDSAYYRKNRFLKLLKDNLKGIDYIDHRKYIEEYRMDLEKYKEKIELREYIENADYA